MLFRFACISSLQLWPQSAPAALQKSGISFPPRCLAGDLQRTTSPFIDNLHISTCILSEPTTSRTYGRAIRERILLLCSCIASFIGSACSGGGVVVLGKLVGWGGRRKGRGGEGEENYLCYLLSHLEDLGGGDVYVVEVVWRSLCMMTLLYFW